MKRATIKQIAEKAELGVGTVSMALNNDPRIAETTRKRVAAIARALNYHPNETARHLVTGRSGVIAVISPRYSSVFSSHVLDAIERKSWSVKRYERGIRPYSTWNIKKVRDQILSEILYSRRADAVILCTLRPSSKTALEYKKAGIPMILLEFDMPGMASIKIDNFTGAYSAADYLIKKKGRNICLIAGNIAPAKGQDVHPAAVERLEGYKAALKDNKIPFDGKKVYKVWAYDYDDGISAVKEFARKKIRMDGILCAAGDITAMGAMEQAIKMGYSIPGDIGIIGYDNMMIARLARPALTTVEQPIAFMGQSAFVMALDAIDGKIKKAEKKVLDTKLIIRESA